MDNQGLFSSPEPLFKIDDNNLEDIGNADSNITARWELVDGGTSFTGFLIFNTQVTLPTDRSNWGDIWDVFVEDLPNNAVDKVTWSIDFPFQSTSPDGGSSFFITLTPNSDLTRRIQLQINAGTFLPGGPSENVRSELVLISSQQVSGNIARGIWSSVIGGSTLVGKIYFTSDVTGITAKENNIYNAFQIGTGRSFYNLSATEGDPWYTTISPDSDSVNANEIITITTTIPDNITSGSYKFRLKDNTLNSDDGRANTPTYNIDSEPAPINVNANVDDQSTYQLTIPIPQNRQGTIQISVKGRSFHVHDEPEQLGPSTQQYLGTISYNNSATSPALIIGDAYITDDPSAEGGTQILNTDENGNEIPLTYSTVWIEIKTNEKDATGLCIDSFIVTNATKGNDLTTIVPNRIWRLPIDLPENEKGSFTVLIPNNVVNEGNPPTSKDFLFDTVIIAGVPFVEDVNIPSGRLDTPFNIDIRFSKPISKVSLESFIFDGADLELPDLYYYAPWKSGNPWSLLSSFKVYESAPRDLIQNGLEYFLIGSSRKALSKLVFRTRDDAEEGEEADIVITHLKEGIIVNPRIENFDNEDKIDPRGIASDGTDFYIIDNANNAFYRLNKSSGRVTMIKNDYAETDDETDFRGLASNDSNILRVICGTTNRIYNISPDDGTLSVQTSLGRITNPVGLTYYNNTFYTFNLADNSIYPIGGSRIRNRSGDRLPQASGLATLNEKLYLLSPEYKGSIYYLELNESKSEIIKVERIPERIGIDQALRAQNFQLRFDKPAEDISGNLNLSLKANTVE